jgi:hypothetical protein
LIIRLTAERWSGEKRWYLFFVISGAYILFLFGLGYLVANSLCLQEDNLPFFEKLPFILTTGFLVNHLILLLGQSLQLSLLWGVIICGCGLVWFFLRWKKEIIFDHSREWVPIVAMAIILIIYYFTILYDPLEEWDARSIWFFHSKMIWSAGSLNMEAGWNHPSVRFSHVDYPILIPALAAQLSYVLGYWNEYAPKLSLFLLLIPAIFWIFSFYSHRFSFLFLVLVFPFGLKSHLWNGFMDGYIAFYAAITVLLLGRYFQERRLIDLMSAVSCLALVSNIKNEGLLIGLLGVVSIAITGILSTTFKISALKKHFSLFRMTWLAVMITPCILWSVFYKYQWHLVNDLQVGTEESFFRMSNRFFDGVSFPLILKETIFHDESSVWLALAVFLAGLIWLTILKRHIVSWIPALITAITYYCCILMIYLMTPNDLVWHLGTSVQRTMLIVSSCMIAGTFFILKELEDVLVAGIYKKESNL